MERQKIYTPTENKKAGGIPTGLLERELVGSQTQLGSGLSSLK
ncbi:MAG: hypothetical protein SNJ68_05655 [Cyanobacteriota bacterium]